MADYFELNHAFFWFRMLSYANFNASLQAALSLMIELTLAIVFSASLWVNYMLYIMMVKTTF